MSRHPEMHGVPAQFSVEFVDSHLQLGAVCGFATLPPTPLGLKTIDPSLDSQSGLDAEFDAAKKMAGK